MKHGNKLFYLATPFSKYTNLYTAASEANRIASDLMGMGFNIFAPVPYMSQYVNAIDADPRDGNFWLYLLEPYIQASEVMIVGMMRGWDESVGIAKEKEMFRAAGKPVMFYHPKQRSFISDPGE